MAHHHHKSTSEHKMPLTKTNTKHSTENLTVYTNNQNKNFIKDKEGYDWLTYVPGTTPFIQGGDWPEGGWVVVSCTPERLTSVDRAANHPEFSTTLPISAIDVLLRAPFPRGGIDLVKQKP